MLGFFLILVTWSLANSFVLPPANRIVAAVTTAADLAEADRGCTVVLDPRLASSPDVIGIVDRLVSAGAARGMAVVEVGGGSQDGRYGILPAWSIHGGK